MAYKAWSSIVPAQSPCYINSKWPIVCVHLYNKHLHQLHAAVYLQEMGKMWQSLDEKAKGPYEKKAEAAKKKYAEEMAAYEA